LALMECCILVAFALTLVSTMCVKAAGIRRKRLPLVSVLTMADFFLTLLATVAAAVVMTLTTHYHSSPGRALQWKEGLAAIFTDCAIVMAAFAVAICAVALLTLAGTLAAAAGRSL